MKTLFLLVASHYVCDFALQNEFIATYKAKTVHGKSNPIWFHILFAHCMMQGLGVYLATQNVLVATLEVIAHFAIDYAKSSENVIGFHTDQALHIACKVVWYLILTQVV